MITQVLTKGFLSFEYFKASSNAPAAIPSAWDAIPIRPPFNVPIAKVNPNPSSPILFAFEFLHP